MLSFLTLFLGLVVGVHEVEVVGAGEAARVELRIDGRTVAELTDEPWRSEVDFGGRLLPHRLEAVAFDAAAGELARAEQWLNLPRSRAEASLVMEAPGEVSLLWESLENKRPRSVTVWLDGEPLPTGDGWSYRLPALDPAAVHFLRAELEFEGNVRSRVESVVGGRFGDQATVEMTAAVLERGRGEELPPASELTGRLRAGGSQPAVVAVEEAPWELLVVLARDAVPGLGMLGRMLNRGQGAGLDSRDTLPGWEVRFVSPQPSQRASSEVPVDLFPISTPFTAADGELAYLLTHVDLSRPRLESRLAEAVAVAAVQAAAGNRPRAVLLVLGAGASDASRFGLDEVRAYLAALQVPLVVWSTGPAIARTVSPDRRPLVPSTPWGKARDVSSLARFESAVRQLVRLLDAQAIAWVEGAHLPQSFELEPAPGGPSIAGR